MNHDRESMAPSSFLIAGRKVSFGVSEMMEDPCWDDFLQRTPLGHFQQSSLWAQAKLSDGWSPIRFILRMDGQITGGFQILARHSRLGKIGYICKGPVLEPEDPILMDLLIKQVVAVARTNQLKALIVQLPDASGFNDELFTSHSFLPNHLIDLVTATLLLDLSGGMPDIEKRMRKSTLAQVKRTQARKVTIREGTEYDISTFFSLMASTCERQRTKPVPSTETALMAVWRAFHAPGSIRMGLAECENEIIAGIICIRFGQRVTAWKKGWSGAYSEQNPNHLLMYDAIQWAHRTGSEIVDFSALNRRIAENLLNGISIGGSAECRRDWFNLGYGNRPQLLPESHVYISNPLSRLLYKGVSLACD